MSITWVAILFLLQLAVGMVVTLLALPTEIVDRRFVKNIQMWAWLFTAAALLLRWRTALAFSPAFGAGLQPDAGAEQAVVTLYLVFGAGLTVQWLRLRWSPAPRSGVLLWGTALAGLAALAADALLFRPALAPGWVMDVVLPLNFLSAAGLLGGFLTGMIFGHWYLVNTDMPKRLLTRMALVIFGVIGLRLAAVAATLWLYAAFVFPDQPFLDRLISFLGHGIFFWERVLVGLAIPIGVAALVWGTARIESNQSATGILYVGVAFVLIGELIARYLFLITAIPL